MRRSPLCCSLAGIVAIAGLAGTTSPAAPVVWHAPEFLLTDTATSGSEVDNSNLLLAKTFNPAANTAVNGVTFSNSSYQNGLTISWSSPVAGAGISNNLVTQGQWIYTNPAFTQVLDQGIDVWQNYANGEAYNTFDLTLGGLTTGNHYTVQFFVAKFNWDNSSQTITSGGSTSDPIFFANDWGKKGSYITGSFIADATTQVFTFTGAHWSSGNAAATLNAVTVAGLSNPGGMSYYVSPSGVDASNRDGLSPATAWATPGYALGRVPPGISTNPNTIRLAAGSYTVPQATVIPPCVNLQGAGMAATTVHAGWVNSSGELAAPAQSASMFLVASGGYNDISGITFTGNNRQAGGAFWMSQASHITLGEVAFTDFGSTTINIQDNCRFISVTDASFNECGYESFDYSLGAIGIHQLEDALFSRITMRSTLAGTGYGFKAAVGYLRRTVFEHLDIRLKNPQAWNNLGAPNFALEFWHTEQADNILRYSYFGGNSVSQDTRDASGSGTTMRVHDNVFDRSAYGIEVYTPRMEIDHNHFIGGFATIVWFGNGGTTDGMYIHHNVAEDVGLAFYTVGGTAANLRLEHNTVYFANSPNYATHAFLANNNPANTPANWSIRNNIMVAPPAYPGLLYQHGGTGPQPSGVNIAGNILMNMDFTPPSGSAVGRNPNTDPGLRLQGAKPVSYYSPAGALSTAVDVGVDLGQPYAGGAPDAGAYEFNGIIPPVGETLLFDHFDAGSTVASSFNDTLAADQTGQIAPLQYAVTTAGQDWQAQHGNAGTMLLVGNAGYGATASLNADFSLVANRANLPISFLMDAVVTETTVPSCWSSISIGSAKNITANDARAKFGILPVLDGSLQVWVNGTQQPVASHAGNTFRIVLSNTTGTGSAFNGNGSKATLYDGSALVGTYTLPQLADGDGYLSFSANPYNGSWNLTRIDNLSIDLISDYDTWADSFGLVGGQSDDDDHDGVSNFTEYAFALDPKSGASTQPYLGFPIPASGTFTYSRRMSVLSRMSFTIWTSTDLTHWTKDTGAIQSAVGTNGGSEIVQVVLGQAPSSDKFFVRVTASGL